MGVVYEVRGVGTFGLLHSGVHWTKRMVLGTQ